MKNTFSPQRKLVLIGLFGLLGLSAIPSFAFDLDCPFYVSTSGRENYHDRYYVSRGCRLVDAASLKLDPNKPHYKALEVYAAGDKARAFSMWKESAAGGDIQSQSLLGTIYYEGMPGVSENFALALDNWWAAAEHGDTFSLHALGVLYSAPFINVADHQINEVTPSKLIAYALYNEVANFGGNDSSRNLKSLIKTMTPAEIADGNRIHDEWVSSGKSLRVVIQQRQK